MGAQKVVSLNRDGKAVLVQYVGLFRVEPHEGDTYEKRTQCGSKMYQTRPQTVISGSKRSAHSITLNRERDYGGVRAEPRRSQNGAKEESGWTLGGDREESGWRQGGVWTESPH